MKRSIIILSLLSLTALTGLAEAKTKTAKTATPRPSAWKAPASLTCFDDGYEITVVVAGDLTQFRYGQDGLFGDSKVCLVGDLTGWKTRPDLCHEYKPLPVFEYRFGPMALPKKSKNDFILVNAAGPLEYRWTGIQWLDISGSCQTAADESGLIDRFMFAKLNGKKSKTTAAKSGKKSKTAKR